MTDRPPSPDEARPTSDTPGVGPRDLPLLALRETVIFPEMIVPLQVGRDKSVKALNQAVADGSPIALVTQRQAEARGDSVIRPSCTRVGTLAKVAQVVQLQDGTVRAIVQGQQRLRVLGFRQTDPYIIASVEPFEDEKPAGLEIQALMHSVQSQIEQYVQSGAPLPAGGGRRGPQHHRAGAAGGHGRVQPRHEHRTAGRSSSRRPTWSTPSGWRSSSLALATLGCEMLELEGSRSRSEVQAGMDREPARVLPARAAQGDPARAWRNERKPKLEVNELRTKIDEANMPEEAAREARARARPPGQAAAGGRRIWR